MRVLYVTSEVFPYAKTGGLADVSAALPVALKELGIDVRVLVPGYQQALERVRDIEQVIRLGDPLGCGEVKLLETRLSHSDVPVWLVDCPKLYRRPGGLYQTETGADWPDNALRFALLNHVAAGIANEPGRAWRPDLIHCNDWHAALVPLLLSAGKQPCPATLLTIHNLAYQGVFSGEELPRLDLPASAYEMMEFYGQISFLKAGIGLADAITTVSPNYAGEILTSEYGCGLEGLLQHRAPVLTGILNGVDYRIWDPSTDPHLVCNYSNRSFAAKSECKRAIQAELGLEPAPGVPLLAFMSRLVHQKMPDVVLETLPPLIEQGMQFVLVAEGDMSYQAKFRELADAFPRQVAVKIGYEEALGHRVLSGADMLLHPSRFEPCGLVPIYALRYGTIPLVRRSGGMADTVVDASPEAIREGTATGFSFETPSAEELTACIRRAVSLYGQPIAWRRLQSAAMRQDFSWQRSAGAYGDLYLSLTGTAALELPEPIIVQTEELEKLTA